MNSIIRFISAMIVVLVIFINALGNIFGVGDLIPTQPDEPPTTVADETGKYPTETLFTFPDEEETTIATTSPVFTLPSEPTTKPFVSTTIPTTVPESTTQKPAKPTTSSKPVEDTSKRVVIGGKSVCFGWNAEKIKSVLGAATDTFYETTTDGEQIITLVYASDYSKFAVYQIADGVFSGFYTVNPDAVITDGVKSYSIASSGDTSQSKLDIDEYTDSYNGNSVYAIYVAYDNFYLMADDLTSQECQTKLNFYATNAVRAVNGLYAYKYCNKAAKAIGLHCDDMAARGYFSHVSPEGKSVGDRLRAQGINYRACAENIGGGLGNAFIFVDAWYNSKTGHRDALLSTTYIYMGAAFSVAENGTTYTGQNFYKSF